MPLIFLEIVFFTFSADSNVDSKLGFKETGEESGQLSNIKSMDMLSPHADGKIPNVDILEVRGIFTDFNSQGQHSEEPIINYFTAAWEDSSTPQPMIGQGGLPRRVVVDTGNSLPSELTLVNQPTERVSVNAKKALSPHSTRAKYPVYVSNTNREAGIAEQEKRPQIESGDTENSIVQSRGTPADDVVQLPAPINTFL